MASVWVRLWVQLTYHAGRGLASVGLRPGTLTGVGLGAALLVPAVAALRGSWLFVAAGLVLLTALADSVAGAVTLLTSQVSRLDAFYDAMARRLAEAAWLVGLWLVGVPGMIVTFCGGLVWLHEYVRAQATLAGVTVDAGVTGVAERPTRVILAVAALAVAGLAGRIDPQLVPGAATAVVAVWVALGLVGGARLASAVRAALR